MRTPSRTWVVSVCAGALASAVPLTASAQSQAVPSADTSPGAAAAPTPHEKAPIEGSWQIRYRETRRLFEAGNTGVAYERFLRLIDDAVTDADRRLAREMAAVCRAHLERLYGPRIPLNGAPRIRTSEELSVLYATAFLYGMGTGAWFILQTRPSSVPTAIAPFAGLTIASVGAVTVVDRYRPFEPGVPQSIAAGTYLGLGQAAWIVGFQQARASRIEASTGYDSAWNAPTVATVLWGGATAGAALGTVVGLARKPSPGRVSYTFSAGLWSGAIAAFGAGALLPEGRRLETSLLIGGGAYNAGILTGLITSPIVSPSLTRVRLVDLGGVAGGLLGSATYLATDKGSDQRATFGATALGAGLGLGLAWWLTSGMARGDDTASLKPSWNYALVPTQGGGAEIRAAYTM